MFFYIPTAGVCIYLRSHTVSYAWYAYMLYTLFIFISQACGKIFPEKL